MAQHLVHAHHGHRKEALVDSNHQDAHHAPWSWSHVRAASPVAIVASALAVAATCSAAAASVALVSAIIWIASLTAALALFCCLTAGSTLALASRSSSVSCIQ